MKIAVGTKSEQKLGYLNGVLQELNLEADIVPLGIASGVSEQPISSGETKQGSINRAKGALRECKDADMAMGIEVGYHPNKNGDYKIFCWVSIVGADGKLVSASSHRLLLPSFYQKLLRDDKDLCEHVELYMDENQDDLSQKLGTILKHRKPFIETSIRLALFEYLIDN